MAHFSLAENGLLFRDRQHFKRISFLEFPAVGFILFVTAVRSLAREDITFWDESSYLSMGLSVGTGQFADFSSGPTYGYLFFLISQFVDAPVDLYFAGRGAAAALLILGVWFSARILSGPVLAWTAGAALAISPSPYAWPGVAAPAAAALVVGCAVMLRWRTPVTVGIASGLFWLAAGARPEFSWLALATTSTVMVWAGVILLKHRNRQLTRRRIGGLVAATLGSVAVPVTLVLLHGSAFQRTGRDWVAFGQHFSQRHFAQGEDPWLDWQDITARKFPDADGLVSALFTNPQAFVWHVVSNVRATPSIFFRESLGVESTPALFTTITGLALVSLLAGLLLSILVQPRTASHKARYCLKRLALGSAGDRIVLALLSLTAVAAVVPVVLIYPRIHYLVLPSAILAVGVVTIQANIGSPRYSMLLPVAAIALILLLTTIQTYSTLQQRMLNPPILATTAKALAESGQGWRLLGVDSGFDVYVPNLQQVLEVDTKGVDSFPSLLDREDINAVLVNLRLEWASWSDLDQFDLFMRDPSKFGFHQVVPGSPIWVRNSA